MRSGTELNSSLLAADMKTPWLTDAGAVGRLRRSLDIVERGSDQRRKAAIVGLEERLYS